jgi:hypothetical protein
MITREDIRHGFVKCGIILMQEYNDDEYFDDNIGSELELWHCNGVYVMTSDEWAYIDGLITEYFNQKDK